MIDDGQIAGMVSLGDLALAADPASALAKGQPGQAQHLTAL